jgi:glycosyltransferase involved in cell wall biosynthesis
MSQLISHLRLIRNVALLLVIGIAGFGVRRYRRWLRLRPRIWRGMFPSHLIPLQVNADRAAGFPSRSVVTSLSGSYELVRADEFTMVLAERGVENHDLLWVGLFDLVLRADIWVAFFDGLFYSIERQWENRFILGFLRLTGIKTIMVNYGGDVITWQGNRGRYDWIARLQQDYPHWDIKAESAKTSQRVALFCKHAAFVCNGDWAIDRMTPRRDLVFKYIAVDCRNMGAPPAMRNAVPVLLHAPQHRYVKGTDLVLRAADGLRSKGFKFELKLIERIPHREALLEYAKADVILDQFCIGAWGAFAQEGMALGKPVLSYLSQEHLSDPAFNMPIVNANAENLERVLAALIRVPELRRRLGIASRAAVEKYQSVEAIGEVWSRIYEHVWWKRPLQLETTAHFGPSRQARAFTEDPGDAEFWPVPVGDLMPAIAAAINADSTQTMAQQCAGLER